ncbi:MAG: hypothetical protein Q8R04_02190 [Nanoarchaeota archaeon]|nr:hypothetical protein [Nanoarchaeota archaeon]
MASIDIWQGIVQGFSTGLGVGFANWLLIKRLEALEKKLQIKINGRNRK